MALQTYTFTEVDIAYVPSTTLSFPSVSIDVEVDLEAPITSVIIGDSADPFAPPLTGIVYPLFR